MSAGDAAVAPAPSDQAPAAHRPTPVSSGAAALLLAAAVVVAALVSISVARLVPFDEDEAAVEASRSVPEEPAGATALDGVAPIVTFDGGGPALPDGELGSWSIEDGAWSVEAGRARASDTGEEGALAVATAPPGSDIAQVTVLDPEPGTGLVVSYRGPEEYVALQVGRGGSTVQLVEVDGNRRQPRLLIVGNLADPDAPLVLAVRRRLGGYEAIANGFRLGQRDVEADQPDPWRIGLVTGPRDTATATTFDDLVVQ